MREYFVKVDIPSDKVDEAITLYNTVMLPSLREHEGYRRSQLFLDRANSTALWWGGWADDPTCGSLEGYLKIQLEKLSAVDIPAPELWQFEAGPIDTKDAPDTTQGD